MTPGPSSVGLPPGMQLAARQCRWIPLPTRERHKTLIPLSRLNRNRRAISRCTPAFEDLDDDHPAAVARTRMRECLRLTIAGAVGVTGRILWRRYASHDAR